MVGKVIGNGVALTWTPTQTTVMKRLRARSTSKGAVVTVSLNGHAIINSKNGVVLSGRISVGPGVKVEIAFSGMEPKGRGVALLLVEGG